MTESINNSAASDLNISAGSVKNFKDAIILANECSESCEGVGLLYWMESCMDEDTPEYAMIKEILSQNAKDSHAK